MFALAPRTHGCPGVLRPPRHYMSMSGSSRETISIAYWAEVLEMRMNSGGVGQNGGGGGKSDCEICKRIVVILEVEGCHDVSDLD
jgi:hypothetical protein